MNSIIHGDALETLQAFEDNVFDAIIADPPCGISFMNKSWDSNKGGRDQWIAWLASIMREALRTLKTGGHCLVWALPRTSHWTATALENAGFEIRDVIHHMYSADTALQGFLASLNTEQHEAFERLVESQGSSVLYHLFGSGFPKSLDVSKSIDAYHKAEREVVGTNEAYKTRNPNGMTGTFRLGGCASIKELRHAAENKEKTPDGRDAANVLERVERERLQCQGANITAPATDAAKQWQGFGSALKPAAEHWILCRKPLAERSIAENVLKWGVGALNIDASRVNPGERVPGGGTYAGVFGNGKPANHDGHANGRFPAHLVLSHSLQCTEEHCVDGCPVLALDRQSGTRKSGALKPHRTATGNFGNGYPSNVRDVEREASEGTASRYFAQFRPDVPPFYYASKASRRERSEGCDALPGKTGPVMNDCCIHCGKGRLDGRRSGACCENPVYEHRPPSGTVQNHHPTVKPLSLMKYLATLITPPNGVILDMFAGSGTTGVAAVERGMRYVLIEQSPEYVEIARARVTHAERVAV